MKKRLLITSIVMMLVVAVALSTATYAWFTSNATVSASSMTLKAGVSSEAALGIGWTGSGARTSIESNVYAASLQPMAPTALTVDSTTAEALKFYTSTTKTEDGIYKFNTTPAENANVPPVVYNDGASVSSFYVRNLSNANTVGTVIVKAVFGDYMVLATVLEEGVTYYTKDGSNYTKYNGAITPGSYTPEPEEPTLYAYVPYVLTKDTTAVAGTTYWEPSAVGSNKYQEVENVIAETTNVEGKYEEVTADDMIRVAIFTKEYKQATGAFNGSGTYYAYDTTTNVMDPDAVQTPVEADFGKYFTLTSTDHVLKCVLGKEDTGYVNVGSDAYDVNKVYFKRTGTEGNYTYTQTAYSASEYASETKANLFTATSTAVYGTIAANGAVKALSYYNNVVNEYVIASNLKPGEQVDIVAYAWLDGTMLDDGRQGEVGTVSLLFSAGPAA